jgi:hypothetical protein
MDCVIVPGVSSELPRNTHAEQVYFCLHSSIASVSMWSVKSAHRSLVWPRAVQSTALISCSLNAEMDLVQQYCAGSGAKLNVSKTNVMKLNRNARHLDYPGLNILLPTESCRYLGLPIGQ